MTESNLASPALQRLLKSQKSREPQLARAFETGEAHTRKASRGPVSAFGRISSQFISRTRRPAPVSADREASCRRRRKWGGSSGMPSGLRECYTEGERAALAVIAAEFKKFGYCDRAIDAIAAAAGVSRTTVQNALRKAQGKDLGHVSVQVRPQPGRKNLTNRIRIISKAWLDWLKRSIGFKSLHPSKSKEENSLSTEQDQRSVRALERETAASISDLLNWPGRDRAKAEQETGRGRSGSQSLRQDAIFGGRSDGYA